MNVLILGCSFGVPGNGCPEQYHTENQLKDLGHTVYNFSIRGAGNLETLDSGIKFIETNPNFKVDWLVWFHTELIRDNEELGKKTSKYYSLDYLSKLVYNEYAKFIRTLNCKIAVIGGAAPIYPNFFDYITPDFCIPSWFNEILNLELPQIQTLSKPEAVAAAQGIGSWDKLKVLERHEEILNALEASEDFPDNYHAGMRPHIELSKRLHRVMSGG